MTADHKHSPDPLRNHGYTDHCSCGLRIHRDDDFDWVPDDGELDACIAEVEAECERLRVCGNCAEYNVFGGLGWHGNPATDGDSFAASHGDSCHYRPSRWDAS